MGLLRFILAVILLYAVVCGVTIKGQHYGLAGCNCDQGVVFEWGDK
jgi:hypothetical protein